MSRPIPIDRRRDDVELARRLAAQAELLGLSAAELANQSDDQWQFFAMSTRVRMHNPLSKRDLRICAMAVDRALANERWAL